MRLRAVGGPSYGRPFVLLLRTDESRSGPGTGAPARELGVVCASMGLVAAAYSIRHFSQSNPAGTEQNDVPALLTRVAESIRELGEVEVQDIVFHFELDDKGEDWPSMTVYFHTVNDLTSGSAQP